MQVTRIARCAIVAVSLCAAAFASSVVTAPDWVREQYNKPRKSYAPETNAVVLRTDLERTVTHPGEYTETVRRVVRILRPEAAQEGIFDTSSLGKGDELQNAHAWCIDEGEHVYEVKQKEFVEKGRWETFELYNDRRYYEATVPVRKPGSVVAVEYTVRKRGFMDQETWIPQEDIPVEDARFTLILPTEWKYQALWANTPSVAPVAGAGSRVTWTLHDLPPIQKEEDRPAMLALAGRMEVTYFPSDVSAPSFASWEGIGKWYDGLSSGSHNVTPEIAATAHALTAGATDFDSTVSRLASYLQSNIRYVAIEIGIGGWQPHKAADVLRYQYGDCKDKATLLKALLEAQGIHSSYLVIHTVHGVSRQEAPSTLFNHVILAIDLPASSKTRYRSVVTTKSGARVLVFDPTDEWTPLGELNGDEQGNYALLVRDGVGELIQLPTLEPEHNRLARNGTFVLSADGALSGDLEEVRTGNHAWNQRGRLKRATELERTQYTERYFSAFLKAVSVQQSKIEGIDSIDRELKARYKLTASAYLRSTGPLFLFQPCVLGRKSFALEWKKRKYPVQFAASTLETDSYEIAVPAGFVVDDLPEGVQIDVGFASYKSQIEAKNGRVFYHREFSVRAPFVPLEKMADLRRLEETIARDESSSVVLRKQ